METEYVILRSVSPQKGKRGLGRLWLNGSVNTELRDEAKAAGIGPANALKVERMTLKEGEAAGIARDDTTLDMMPDMPMSLIAPLATADDVAIRQAEAAGMSWGIQAVGADKTDLSGKDVTVAVLDTGIDPTHPAFAGVDLHLEGFTGLPSNTADDHGHGTHCAGTIFGRDVGKVRIGIARGVTKALIGKVLDKHGHGSSGSIADAIHWALGRKANVVSMSLGLNFPGMVERLQQRYGLPPALAGSRALRAFRDNLRFFDSLVEHSQALGSLSGATSLFVAASGNESRRDENPDFKIEVGLPAASKDFISVGALKQADGKFAAASFSNINPTLSAPGVGIVSARMGGGLAAKNGTSMACPHVAGAAALWWEHLRKARKASGKTVSASLIATASSSSFSPAYDIADHGLGLVRSP